jgi:hypothetical protein
MKLAGYTHGAAAGAGVLTFLVLLLMPAARLLCCLIVVWMLSADMACQGQVA